MMTERSRREASGWLDVLYFMTWVLLDLMGHQ